MTRTIAAALGLAVGLATLAAAGPASAVHIRLNASGVDDDAVVTEPVGAAPIAEPGEGIRFFGELVDADDGTTFTHRFSFGVELPPGVTTGPGSSASATPNVNPVTPMVGDIIFAGFSEFEGTLEGPGLPAGGVPLLPADPNRLSPRQQPIGVTFAAMDTGGTTPYLLTVTGTLFPGALDRTGNYTGNISVVPLPGAALLFLTALGGLAFVRGYRRRREEGDEGAVATAA